MKVIRKRLPAPTEFDAPLSPDRNPISVPQTLPLQKVRSSSVNIFDRSKLSFAQHGLDDIGIVKQHHSPVKGRPASPNSLENHATPQKSIRNVNRSPRLSKREPRESAFLKNDHSMRDIPSFRQTFAPRVMSSEKFKQGAAVLNELSIFSSKLPPNLQLVKRRRCLPTANVNNRTILQEIFSIENKLPGKTQPETSSNNELETKSNQKPAVICKPVLEALTISEFSEQNHRKQTTVEANNTIEKSLYNESQPDVQPGIKTSIISKFSKLKNSNRTLTTEGTTCHTTEKGPEREPHVVFKPVLEGSVISKFTKINNKSFASSQAQKILTTTTATVKSIMSKYNRTQDQSRSRGNDSIFVADDSSICFPVVSQNHNEENNQILPPDVLNTPLKMKTQVENTIIEEQKDSATLDYFQMEIDKISNAANPSERYERFSSSKERLLTQRISLEAYTNLLPTSQMTGSDLDTAREC